MSDVQTKFSYAEAKTWLVEKFAYKLSVPASEIDVNKIFTDFGLDSTETLVLAGEMEQWLGFELPPTAMWYHPTIEKLANYLVEAKDLFEKGEL
ncbi:MULTISPECIES: acyl carrier protein [Rhizobium/Agrobacterium group]|uniref:Polyketide synthase n=2 Tax=Rhizobium/Agrobacterium group TaxID=227290 RepID=B9K1G5_ALLAM|nr:MULTISPECIES: acyl carrier protein [Rhizobium/Agrobacterium group]MCF1497131.1 acyl carrier protein [Allorhizobium sp. Av2]ACM38713.1 polyketide synthase [Allorhizobium ampelinum S4]KAA3518566.1 acyl carrier protein [Agrobacterium vitis]KAA3530162.1 acyl carrier protein [Agrobacterium vitis]MBF2713500.1 acyl carrier protein [Agrobacterium vitis]